MLGSKSGDDMSKTVSKLNPFDSQPHDSDPERIQTPTTRIAGTYTPTIDAKVKVKSSPFPSSSQSWLVALAAKVHNLNDVEELGDEGEKMDGRGKRGGDREAGGEDEEEDDDAVPELGFWGGSRSGHGGGQREDDEWEKVDGEKEDGESGEDRDLDGVSVSRITAISKRLGKMRAMESDDVKHVSWAERREDSSRANVGSSGGKSPEEAAASEIQRLYQLVQRLDSENLKLKELNKDLQDDLAEFAKSVQGPGTLTESDKEIRERMFADMHKLVQKVGLLEKKNAALEAENTKLRSMLDVKPVTVEIQTERPSSQWDSSKLVPRQDTIESHEVVKMVEDLNTKIRNLAIGIRQRTVPIIDTTIYQRRRADDILADASCVVGKKFAEFLKQHTTNQNTPRIIIRIGLQAVLARVCETGIANWCPHSKKSSEDFSAVHEDIMKTVNRTVAEDWSRITHSHIQVNKKAWKKKAVSNLKSIIDLVYYPFQTPTESWLTEHLAPALDPLFYAVNTLRSAITTGLVTKTLYISFPTAGQEFAVSWMEPFILNLDESTSEGAANGNNSLKWVMASISLGLDKLTRSGGLKSVMKPTVVLEQPPLLTNPVRRSTAVGVGPRLGVGNRLGAVQRFEAAFEEAQQRRSQAAEDFLWSRRESRQNSSPRLPPRRFSMAVTTPPGGRPP